MTAASHYVTNGKRGPMSAAALSWAWDSRATQNEKLLLLFLADNADIFGFGSSLPKLLAEAQAFCGIESPQTIRHHIKSLVEGGFVTVEADAYKLNISPERKPKRTFSL